MALSVVLNGREQVFEALSAPATLTQVIDALQLKADRVAAELNGGIVPRTSWSKQAVRDGDKLEIVHFVGGGGFS